MTKELRKITPAQVADLLAENYPNLSHILVYQNWYSYTEALEDLTDFVNKLLKIEGGSK